MRYVVYKENTKESVILLDNTVVKRVLCIVLLIVHIFYNREQPTPMNFVKYICISLSKTLFLASAP